MQKIIEKTKKVMQEVNSLNRPTEANRPTKNRQQPKQIVKKGKVKSTRIKSVRPEINADMIEDWMKLRK